MPDKPIAPRAAQAAAKSPASLSGLWLVGAGLLTVALAAPALLWPFGRDQAIFHYIGRQWGAGQLPYRDAFDVKPPGIFALYRLTSAIGGDGMWTIRAADSLAVAAIGALLPWAWPGRSDKRPSGADMVTCALLSIAGYYCLFDFWDTAQAETWQMLGCVAAAAVARWVPNWTAPLLAGVFLGAAAMFKPTALLMAPWAIANGLLSPRQPGGPARAGVNLGLGAVGTLVVPALMLGWLWHRGAGPALRELLDYQLAYAKVPMGHGDAFARLKVVYFRQHQVWPWLVAVAATLDLGVGLFKAGWRSALNRTLASAALLGLAMASVAAQRKFFTYHYVALFPLIVGIIWSGISRIGDVWGLARTQLAILAPAAIALWLTAPPWAYGDRFNAPLMTSELLPRLVDGSIDKEVFYSHFHSISNYNFGDHWRIAQAVRALQKPGDRLHVRGFELPIYALTGLSTPARFVSELPLEDDTLATASRSAWQADHDKRLWSDPPRFVVTFVDRQWDIDFLTAKGYRRNTSSGLLLLMVRDTPI